MTRLFATAAAVAVLAAGCQAATNELHPAREELKAASRGSLGQVVVDDEGHAVYLFEKDEPDESYCKGACESVWPPLTTNGTPKLEGSLDASKVTTIKRAGGLTQVVYAGHPLYYYQGDRDPEDTYGQGKNQFGAEWYALKPSGQKDEPEGGGSDAS